MELKKFLILPAAIALSLAFAPVTLAGDGHKAPTPPIKTPTPPTPPTPPSTGGGGSSNDPTIACRIGNRLVYTPTWRQCKQLRFSLGFGGHGNGGGHGGGGHGYTYGGGQMDGEGYAPYQPQRIVRYVARPSRAASMQMEKRARKAARRAARQAAAGYGYGDGAMIGYGNGVMIGGYGNNVVINGNVYAGNQVVVRKKRKGKKARRVYIQHPQFGYEYDGSVMVKGGGY